MSNSISIMGEEVEEYKYLSVHLDNRLDWRCNTDAVYKKETEQTLLLEEALVLQCLQHVLHIFYKSVVERTVLPAVVLEGQHQSQ